MNLKILFLHRILFIIVEMATFYLYLWSERIIFVFLLIAIFIMDIWIYQKQITEEVAEIKKILKE